MNRYIYALFAVLILFSTTACGEKPASVPSPPVEATPPSTEAPAKPQEEPAIPPQLFAKVIKVIDGDTFKIHLDGKEENVRMILVDTPETVHPTKPPQPYGKEASEFTKSLLEGKIAELEKDAQERDKYGWLLMYVYVDGKSVQEQLLERGLAKVSVFQPNVKYVDEYRAIEGKAKKDQVGMWSSK